MANNLMTFENVVENIVPKVTIQRIILETSATDVPSDPKNPHATPALMNRLLIQLFHLMKILISLK